MQPAYTKRRVCENIEISKNIYCLTAEYGSSAVPGQFFMLRGWESSPLLSRPISVHDIEGGTISFLYEVKGKGTGILSRLVSGDYIEMLGPLGNGFDVKNIKGRVAIVTGGIGIAPMFYTVKNLNNCTIDLFSGFRDEIYVTHKFKSYTDNIYIATESGKSGHKGYVTDIFHPWDYSVVLCCGPEIMMRKAAKMCIYKDVPVYMSMESRMACGIGACLVCTCKTKKGPARVCRDGPVFDGKNVVDID